MNNLVLQNQRVYRGENRSLSNYALGFARSGEIQPFSREYLFRRRDGISADAERYQCLRAAASGENTDQARQRFYF